ncbi:MAG: microviridin/marinostatin family tricyclic proteinase inhibitor [Cyanobacteria bacterium P01_H01_bin.153]
MSNQQRDPNCREVPFFARYLEGQITQNLSEEELRQVNGGNGVLTTHKYPSDFSDPVTHKYPSDGDDYEDIIS